MPRKSRIDAAGALHHVMVRGIERGAVFRSDIDRNQFVERLGEILQDTKTLCYAWALIPNHFHLSDGCQAGRGVGQREASADCRGQKSIMLLGGNGTGNPHVFPGTRIGDIDSLCQ
jgi:hypothetical protein